MEKIEELVKNEVKRTFNPEFLNRIDEIILFQSLTDADLMQILELLVQQLNINLAQKAITISVTEDAKKWILEKTSSTAATARAPCAAPCSATSKTRSPRRSSPAASPSGPRSSRSTSTTTNSSIALSAWKAKTKSAKASFSSANQPSFQRKGCGSLRSLFTSLP